MPALQRPPHGGYPGDVDDEMIDGHTRNLVELAHVPISPPRKNHDGEASYLELWQRFVGRLTDEELGEIFRETLYENLTQRQASVAATFVMWLGTNCGRGMIQEADGGKREPDAYRADWHLRYLRRWEMENRRESGVNGGIRYCEAILSPQRSGPDHLSSRTVPTVTIEDLDVIDCICRWLATQDGQAFLRAAEAKVEAASRARRLFGESA